MVALSAFGCKGLTLLSVDGLGTQDPAGPYQQFTVVPHKAAFRLQCYQMICLSPFPHWTCATWHSLEFSWINSGGTSWCDFPHLRELTVVALEKHGDNREAFETTGRLHLHASTRSRPTRPTTRPTPMPRLPEALIVWETTLGRGP